MRKLRADLRAGLRITDLSAVLVSPDGTVNRLGTDAVVLAAGRRLSASDLDAHRAARRQRRERPRTATRCSWRCPAALRRPAAARGDRDRPGRDEGALARDAAAPARGLGGAVARGRASRSCLARRLTQPDPRDRTRRRISSRPATSRAAPTSRRAPTPSWPRSATRSTTMAAQLEHSRGSQRAFLLSISHDLRTPLTSIRGYAEALADGTLDDADPDARKRAANVISSEARRLERLVRDLLDLSRLDSREFSLNPRPCDLTEIVRDAAEAFAPQAQELGIDLRAAAGATAARRRRPGAARADRRQPRGERAEVRDVDDRRLDRSATPPDASPIVVADDGPGHPAPTTSRTCSSGSTPSRRRPGRSVGTGLGLAIVHELAAAMGGTASVDAPPEGGTRFVVSLPARTSTASPTPRSIGRGSDRRPPRRSPRPSPAGDLDDHLAPRLDRPADGRERDAPGDARDRPDLFAVGDDDGAARRPARRRAAAAAAGSRGRGCRSGTPAPGRGSTPS